MAPCCLETSEPRAGVKVICARERHQPVGSSQGLRSTVRSLALPRHDDPQLYPRSQEPREVPVPPGLLKVPGAPGAPGGPGAPRLPKEQVTTLMLRNVPRGYTEEALVLELEAQVGRLAFDFIYLPWDNSRHSNNGHAFVNLVNSSLARALTEQFNGQRWRFARSQKTVGVRVANVQGISLNLAHYVESLFSRCSRPSQPWVLRSGARLPLLDALEAFCPPEVVNAYLQMCSVRSGWTAAAGATAPLEAPRTLEPTTSARALRLDDPLPLTPYKASPWGPHGLSPSPQENGTRREMEGALAVSRKLTTQRLDELFEDSHVQDMRDLSFGASVPNAKINPSEGDSMFLFRLSV